MTTYRVIVKRSLAAGKQPKSSDLNVGELAFNANDRKLFIKDNSNNIIDLTNLDSVTGGILPRRFGGTGFSSNILFNPQVINTLTIIPSGFNAVLAGSITVNPGVSLTIAPNSRVIIL